jgi:hypothetical protein
VPAVIIGGALVALAFAFAALSAGLLIRNTVVNPLRNTASLASGLPVVGDPLAYILVQITILIEIAIQPLDNLANVATSQASQQFSWLVGTIGSYFWQPIFDLTKTAALQWFYWWPGIYNALASSIPALQQQAFALRVDLNNTWSLIAHVWTIDLPAMRGIDAGLRADVNNALRSIDRILTQDLTQLRGIDAGLRNDINNLAKTLAGLIAVDLPAIRSDVARRALEQENIDLRRRVTTLENGLAKVAPLTTIAAAGADAINNLRCMMDTPCDAMNNLIDTDLEARVSNLELGEM